MAEGWAKNDWISGDAVSHTRLNNIGNSQRTIGYGETAGSVTVNANQNHLAALGSVTLTSGGHLAGSGLLYLKSGAASSGFLVVNSAGSDSLYLQAVNAANSSSASALVFTGQFGAALPRFEVTATKVIFNSGFPNYANDAAAAAGGVAVGQLYRNGSVVMIRVS